MRPLTVRDVERALAGSAGSIGAFHLGEESAGKPAYGDTSCLLHRSDGSWMVAYFERGSHHDQRVFDSEHDACADFLDMLGLPTTRG